MGKGIIHNDIIIGSPLGVNVGWDVDSMSIHEPPITCIPDDLDITLGTVQLEIVKPDIHLADLQGNQEGLDVDSMKIHMVKIIHVEKLIYAILVKVIEVRDVLMVTADTVLSVLPEKSIVCVGDVILTIADMDPLICWLGLLNMTY